VKQRTSRNPSSKGRCAVVFAALLLTAVGISVVGKTSAQSPDVPKEKEWHDWAGGPEGNHFVPLEQVTKDNVKQLDVVWSYPYAQTTVNPLVAHGVIYTVARNKSIVALDAATGHEIWIHDGLTGMTERGINYWESSDGSDRRVIFNQSDYVQELDARTGKIIRNFGKNGVVDRRDELGRNPNAIHVQSATPGKVFEDSIIFGSAPGEAYFSAPGDLQAYNVRTGKLLWQFHVIPHPGEFGYETWPKEAWRYVGAANTWGEISVDSKRGIAYFPTGSPTYDFYGGDRVGAGLFGNCLIALDAHTGKRLWHFQNVHHDLWDYDNVSAPQLTTITHNGRKVDVVAMAGKTGFLYVFDRVTGEPIWPIEERKVPASNVPGEVAYPTQPFPTAPPPFARQSFTAADVNPFILTKEKQAALKEQVAKARNEGLFTPEVLNEDSVMMPGHHGGSNWGMTSANPNDGSVYVIAFNAPAILHLGVPAQGGAFGGGRGGPGSTTYTENCAVCHGQDRAGTPAIPSLTNITARLSQVEIRTIITQGRGQMSGFPKLSASDVDQLVTFLGTPAGGGGGFGRVTGPTNFPAGPIAESGPAATRPGGGGRGGFNTGSMADYPEGVDHPATRYQNIAPGGGLDPEFVGPPYTTLTAYDLNSGTIKWQIGLGDDYRVVAAGGPKGTGAAELLKSSVIVTSNGLLFVNAADRKIHIYDSETGKQLHELWLGATTSGSPSMYELGGRQYLLVTAGVGTRIGGQGHAADPNQAGPTGLIAYTLRK